MHETFCVLIIYFYRPQRSWAKVIFLQASVCPQGGGCLPQCMLGYPAGPGTFPPGGRPPQTRHTPPGGRPPRTRHTPLGGRPPWPGTPPPSPPGGRTPRTRHINPSQTRHTPLGSRLQHTVNKRLVRILLECILVSNKFVVQILICQ